MRMRGGERSILLIRLDCLLLSLNKGKGGGMRMRGGGEINFIDKARLPIAKP